MEKRNLSGYNDNYYDNYIEIKEYNTDNDIKYITK